MAEFQDIQFIIGDSDKGNGTLKVGEDNVRWGSFEFEYTQIILHAMCNDTESYPKPCIYMQVENGSDDMEEIRLVPKDPSILQAIFEQLSRCAALHPDEGMDQEDNESDTEFFNASNLPDTTTNAAKLQKLESVFLEPEGPPPGVPGQFDEVDE